MARAGKTIAMATETAIRGFIGECVRELNAAADKLGVSVLKLTEDGYASLWDQDEVTIAASSIVATFGSWSSAVSAAEMAVKVPSAFKATYLPAPPAARTEGTTITVQGVQVAVPEGALAYQLGRSPRWISDRAEAVSLAQSAPGSVILTAAGKAAIEAATKSGPEEVTFVVTVRSLTSFADQQPDNPRRVLREMREEAELGYRLCEILLENGWRYDYTDGDRDEINWVFTRWVASVDELINAYRPALQAAGHLAERYDKVRFGERWIDISEILG